MFKSIMPAVAALFLGSSAIAADLPKRTVAPLPPVVDRTVSEPQFFVGGFAGVGSTDWSNLTSDNARVGVVAGWQPIRYIRLEGVYEYGWKDAHGKHSNSLFGNVIAQYPVGAFTPYALVGTGYRWSTVNETVWNVGGGVRYAITSNVEADLRYRYVSDYNTRNHENVVTLGLNYRF